MLVVVREMNFLGFETSLAWPFVPFLVMECAVAKIEIYTAVSPYKEKAVGVRQDYLP